MLRRFQLKENSAEGLGRSFAGSAAAPGDCSVVVNNPAAMSEIKGGCFQADVTAINFGDEISRQRRGFPRPAADRRRRRRGRHHAAGAGDLFRAFGQRSIRARRRADRAVRIRDRITTIDWVGRYEALKSKLQSPALTFSASWRLSDEFSLGASIIAQRTSADTFAGNRLRHDPRGSDQRRAAAAGSRRFRQLKGDDWGYGFGLGLLWKATPNDNIGINFHSQIDHTIQGDGKFLVPSNVLPLLGGAFVNSPGRPTSTRRRSRR